MVTLSCLHLKSSKCVVSPRNSQVSHPGWRIATAAPARNRIVLPLTLALHRGSIRQSSAVLGNPHDKASSEISFGLAPNWTSHQGARRSGRPPGVCQVTSDGSSEPEESLLDGAISKVLSWISQPIRSLDEPKSLGRGQLKRRIMRAVSNTNRGKDASPQEKDSILALIEELEANNPTSSPALSPLLSGRWALLYTSPVDESTADKYAGTEEGPFLARVKPLSLGLVRQKRSIQVIDSSAGLVDNIAEFDFLSVPGQLSIRGSCALATVPSLDQTSVSETRLAKQNSEEYPAAIEEGRRLNVTFERFTLTIGSLSLPVSLSWVSPKGWVDTTYLDDDFRVGRGDKGSVFVTSRIKNL